MLGGYLTQHASWRAIFLINIPLGILAALMARRVPRTPGHREGPSKPDVLGTLLFALGACVLLFARSSASHRIAWTSPLLMALAAIAAAAFALLFVWERRVSDPMIPVRLLTQAVILRTNFVVMTFGASLFALVLYLPMFLQLGRATGVGESGLLMLPVTLALAAYFTGHFITRTGRLIMPIAGLSLSTLAFIALAATIHWAPTWLILTLIGLGAAGLGTVMPACQIVMQDEAGQKALGATTASVSVSRSFGGAIGSAPCRSADLSNAGRQRSRLFGCAYAARRTRLAIPREPARRPTRGAERPDRRRISRGVRDGGNHHRHWRSARVQRAAARI